jgi:ATP-dependent Clp protease ATP-binding subunit ClpB
MPDTPIPEPREAQDKLPRWLDDIDRLLGLRAQFIISGNVRDKYLTRDSDGVDDYAFIVPCLWNYLRSQGFQFLFVHEPGRLRIHPDLKETRALAKQWFQWPGQGEGGEPSADLPQLESLIRSVSEFRDGRVGFVLEYASRILRRAGDPAEAEFDFFAFCERSALQSRPFSLPGKEGEKALHNPILWVANRREDLPGWLTSDNERIHASIIPRPTPDDRNGLAGKLARLFPTSPTDQAADENGLVRQFVRGTEGMTLTAMHDIAHLARDRGMPFSAIEEAIRCYRIGTPDNPWKSETIRESIRSARERLQVRVRGQTQAITKVVDILMRTAVGLTGVPTSGANTRPRGTLFFAGPTGVGKTELAKALTNLLFGSDDHYVRFDMSEFSSEHASDRLIGAPPGYVGFGAGGELTNAMRRQPCSVVLFDEIEKAHPRLLDKFLQILDDGRLTDGRGETAYFTDAILIFTSNLGLYRTDARGVPVIDETGRRVPTVKRGEPYEAVEAQVRGSVHDHFKHSLGRPELLNRFGDNIVVFNYIMDDVGKQIMDAMLERVADSLSRSHGLTVTVSKKASSQLLEKCLANLDNGGRGIGNRLETIFVNPLSRFLFETDPPHGSSIRVDQIAEKDGVHTIVCKT